MPRATTFATSNRPLRPSAEASFDLLRHFSIACLFGMAVATLLSMALVGTWAREHVLTQGSKANADLAAALANSMWTEHHDDVMVARTLPAHELAASPVVSRLRQHAVENMTGTSVVKVKLYSLDGLTIFSTDPSQIGKSAAGNTGLLGAAAGKVMSALVHRDSFDAFEGTIENRDLLASYVPMRARQGGKVEAVFEIYADVTDMLAMLQRSQWRVTAAVAGVLLLLYVFLLLVVRKADRLIRRQDDERRQREDEIWHQAHHDALTDLPNRSLFARELGDLLQRRTDEVSGSLLYVDLDRFKMVNDSFGHQAGDDVLRAAAARMRGCLRAEDRLYRIGGDEFAILLAGLRAPDDAARVSSRVTEAMAQPIEYDGQSFTLGATIGIAMIPRDGSDIDNLVSNANAAMRFAKHEHRGAFVFYSEDMNERSKARLALETDLQRAYDDDEFVLHYQPRITAASGRMRGVEALIRWQRAGHGLIPPGKFIDVLEQMDLMTKVGEWVLRTACLQLRRWHEQGFVHLGVSVNVSARQLEQPDFADVVRRVMAETRVDPASVELELTETVLIARTEQARRMLSTLRNQGVRIAIDDFGTGYASLTYLRQLAVDVVKLDRSFVGGVETNPTDRALSTAIAEMARALDLTLVAEGVETEAQVRFLASIHCDELQGFLFSRPEPAERLIEMLSTDARSRRPGTGDADTAIVSPVSAQPA